MTNHPNRGWRARALRAFADWLDARYRLPPNSPQIIATAQTVEDAYLAGYEDGRRDVQTRTTRA